MSYMNTDSILNAVKELRSAAEDGDRQAWINLVVLKQDAEDALAYLRDASDTMRETDAFLKDRYPGIDPATLRKTMRS